MNQETWNKHVVAFGPRTGSFLQAWEWGEFQQSLGRTVERVFVEADDGIVLAQAIKMELPFGQFYWSIPRGPLGTMSEVRMIAELRAALPDGMFMRVEPVQPFRLMKVKAVHPEDTILMDLTKPYDEVLAQMKTKTRYNIRLAQRKGVVSKRVSLDRFDDFVRLLEQTTARDQFRGHPPLYYKTMVEMLSGADVEAFLAMAFYEERPIAANVMIDFAGVRTYLHGATSNLHRNVMAQYHLHDMLMHQAKEQGMHTFDFWGVAPDGASHDHPWFGVTRYKTGYGGELVTLPGTYELPLKHVLYAGYRMYKKAKRR